MIYLLLGLTILSISLHVVVLVYLRKLCDDQSKIVDVLLDQMPKE